MSEQAPWIPTYYLIRNTYPTQLQPAPQPQPQPTQIQPQPVQTAPTQPRAFFDFNQIMLTLQTAKANALEQAAQKTPSSEQTPWVGGIPKPVIVNWEQPARSGVPLAAVGTVPYVESAPQPQKMLGLRPIINLSNLEPTKQAIGSWGRSVSETWNPMNMSSGEYIETGLSELAFRRWWDVGYRERATTRETTFAKTTPIQEQLRLQQQQQEQLGVALVGASVAVPVGAYVLERYGYKIPFLGKHLTTGEVERITKSGELELRQVSEEGGFGSFRYTRMETQTKEVPTSYAQWLNEFLTNVEVKEFRAAGTEESLLRGLTQFETGPRPSQPYWTAVRGGVTYESFFQGFPTGEWMRETTWGFDKGVATVFRGQVLSQTFGQERFVREFTINEFIGQVNPEYEKAMLQRIGVNVMGSLPRQAQLETVGIRFLGEGKVGTSIVAARVVPIPSLGNIFTVGTQAATAGVAYQLPKLFQPTAPSRKLAPIIQTPTIQFPTFTNLVPKQSFTEFMATPPSVTAPNRLFTPQRPSPRQRLKETPTTTLIQTPSFRPFKELTPFFKETPKATPIITPNVAQITKPIQTPVTVPKIPTPTEIIPKSIFPPILLPSGGGGQGSRGSLFGKWFKKEQRIKTPKQMLETFFGRKRKR